VAAGAHPRAVGIGGRVVACSGGRVAVVVMVMLGLSHGYVLLMVIVFLRGLVSEAHGVGGDEGTTSGCCVGGHLL
jgi:hypothetical protein